MSGKTDARGYPPRGMNREEAARYVGVSPFKFDDMVKDHRMPLPKRDGARMIWDRFELDVYFDEIGKGGTPFDDAVAAARERTNKSARFGKSPSRG